MQQNTFQSKIESLQFKFCSVKNHTQNLKNVICLNRSCKQLFKLTCLDCLQNSEIHAHAKGKSLKELLSESEFVKDLLTQFSYSQEKEQQQQNISLNVKQEQSILSGQEKKLEEKLEEVEQKYQYMQNSIIKMLDMIKLIREKKKSDSSQKDLSNFLDSQDQNEQSLQYYLDQIQPKIYINNQNQIKFISKQSSELEQNQIVQIQKNIELAEQLIQNNLQICNQLQSTLPLIFENSKVQNQSNHIIRLGENSFSCKKVKEFQSQISQQIFTAFDKDSKNNLIPQNITHSTTQQQLQNDTSTQEKALNIQQIQTKQGKKYTIHLKFGNVQQDNLQQFYMGIVQLNTQGQRRMFLPIFLKSHKDTFCNIKGNKTIGECLYDYFSNISEKDNQYYVVKCIIDFEQCLFQVISSDEQVIWQTMDHMMLDQNEQYKFVLGWYNSEVIVKPLGYSFE